MRHSVIWIKKRLSKRFVSVEFNHFLDTYANAPDLNAKAKAPRERKRPRDKGKSTAQRSENSKRNQRLQAYDTKRFSINIGRVHKINTGAIVRLICTHCDIKSNQIGAVDLGREASVFEVSKEIANSIRKGMEQVKLDGRRISVRAASGGKPAQQSHHQRKKRRDD